MNVNEAVKALVSYALQKKLIEEEDVILMTNRVLEELNLYEYEEPEEEPVVETLDEILECLVHFAYETGVIQSDDAVTKDLFDTKLMGLFVERPSEVIKKFHEKYDISPKEATDWFYEFSKDTNYIRKERVKRDRKWTVESEYGTIDITINLSKPEKDPKAIALMKTMKSASYPKCQLCMENEGYRGRMDHPARQNHRIIPLTIQGNKWGFQYSPYVYYNEHCIVFNGKHTPMAINHDTFEKLFDFIDVFPHYFLGSNADLPIVGGSILTHDHFQGGHYEFAMERAEVEKSFTVKGFEDVKAGIVKWPLSVIRLQGTDRERVIALSDHILNAWRTYSDADAEIYAVTDGEKHNTITPIARMRSGLYEIDLTLRNNLTTKEHPLGLYHPHSEYHHIKKENIGLIEVMGLAVLPSRLAYEMDLLKDCLVKKIPLDTYPDLEKHAEWANEFLKKYPEITEETADEIIRKEVGEVFVHVLEDAGVYKCTEEGRKAFDRFVNAL